MKHYDVIISGAGVGGAACALALATAHDLRILMIERHAGPGNLNRGESLLPPITALLGRWGALDRCRDEGAREVSQMQFYHHRAGLVLDVPLKLPGISAPYWVLPHPAIERAMVETANATGHVEIRYKTRVTSLLRRDGRICGAVVSDDRGTEEEIEARLVVGADGTGSIVRGELDIALHRETYDHALFGIDVERPDEYPDVLRTELHPDGGVLVVPGVGRLGLAAIVRKEHEHLFRKGSFIDKFDLIRNRSPLLADLKPSPIGVAMYKLWRGHTARYWAPGAVLLGDAIHVINPVMAQGMTMAIEDAAALARYVGPVLAAGMNADDIDAACLAYERERRPFNASVIRSSHWMSLLFAQGGFFGDVFRRCALGLANSFLGRLVQRKVWSSFATSPEPIHA